MTIKLGNVVFAPTKDKAQRVAATVIEHIGTHGSRWRVQYQDGETAVWPETMLVERHADKGEPDVGRVRGSEQP
jgi:hypothetical protein